MTKFPKVIYNSVFTLALNNSNARNKEKIKKRVQNMYDYYSNEEKRAITMYDYYTGNINKDNNVNLILENGSFATKEEIEKRKKLIVKYLQNSNLWQGVISFNNDYINENIKIEKLEQEMATKILPMFFKKCNFKDIDKMFYQLALHTDTDNYHFHFSFMEKSPNYIYNNKKIGYRKSGKLKQNEIDFLKAQVIHTIEKEKIYQPLLIETNKELEELKKYFNPKEKNFILKDRKNLLYEEKILRLGYMLYNYRNNNDSRIKYGSIEDKSIKKLTNEIKNYIFSKNNNDFKLEYSNFKTSLKKINNYFYKINKENNLKTIKVDESLITSKDNYFNNYVYNAIVNYALYNYKKEISGINKIKENDIIESIILKNYFKNKKQSRKNILTNYLSSSNKKLKYQNKNEVEKSIKNINDEMEEATKEFSKLFVKENEKTL